MKSKKIMLAVVLTAASVTANAQETKQEVKRFKISDVFVQKGSLISRTNNGNTADFKGL